MSSPQQQTGAPVEQPAGDPIGPDQPAAASSERTMIPVQIAAPVTDGGSAPGDPLVLVGNPRLESRPGVFPASPESPADSVIDGGDVGGLTVRAASLRGDEHRHYAEPRQDSFALHVLTGTGEPLLLAGVADGIGSKPLSHLGSAAVCRILAEEIEPYAARMLDPELEPDLNDRCGELVVRLSARLELEAARRQVSPESLSTTLVAGLFGPPADGQRRAVIFAVGDSPAFVLRAGGFQPTFGQTEEEMAGAATAALPSRTTEVEVRVAELEPGDMVLLCTDGLGNPMRNDMVSKQLAGWWDGDPPSLPAFFWQMSFRAQSFGDDRTAVCVWVR